MIRSRLLFFLIVAILSIPGISIAQTGLVTGSVTDQQNLPLPGVSVIVKGTTKGTTTDADGKYSIQAKESDVLVFSFVGFSSQEIAVGSSTNISVTLEEDISTLQEVVLVGYGEVKKSDLTGSVATLKGDNLNRTASGTVDQLLQGKIAGVQVMTSTGQPGQPATIRIRGASSLNGSKDPLLVVDGYPWGDANAIKQLNPEDIESIEVLKDASSAAIYGSRGANGVILITTRKGKSGQPRISLSTLHTVSTLAVKPDVWRSGGEQAAYDNEAALNGGASLADIPWNGTTRSGVYWPTLSEIRGTDPNKPQWPHNTDWVDLVYRNPLSQSYTLTADGGSDKTRYAVSANYYNEDGLVINNGFDKFTTRLNLDQKLNSAISLGGNVVIANTQSKGQNLNGDRSRIWPVYTPDGAYFRTGPTDFGNPIALANTLVNKTKTFDLFASLYVDATITDWLQFRTMLNTKFGNEVVDIYDPINSTQRAMDNKGSFGEQRNNNFEDVLSESYFTAKKNFGDAHALTFLAGYSIQKNVTTNLSLIGRDFTTDVLQNQNLATANERDGTNPRPSFQLESFYGRVNYSLLDKYLVTFTARSDGSTKFGSANQRSLFPSAALAWKIHEESFLKSVSAISEAKLRVSYGLTGNQGIPPQRKQSQYGSYKYWTGSAFQTGFGPGLAGANDDQGRTIVSGIENNTLKWETTKSLDVGMDIGLLDHRITLTADYYIKDTYDLLRERVLAPSAGFDRMWVNDGEIRNSGIELAVNADVISGDDLTWSVGVNYTANKNEVIAMGESDMVFVGQIYEMIRQQATVFMVNQPMFSYYGYKTAGIIQTEEEGIEAGLSGADAQPGEIKYLDITGDGIVDGDDRTIIGNPNPDFIYSFNTNLHYKRFDLSAQLYGVQGNDVYDFRKMTPSRQILRWTPDNPSNEYPRANNTRGFKPSDFLVVDGSFLRIQNVTFGYNAPSGLIRGVQSLRVYVSANNLYTFTKFNTGFDPEMGENGVHQGAYPRPRAFSLGLNLGF